MNEGNITVTITESQHELILDLIEHGLATIQVVAPYDDGFEDLPLDNAMVQRYTMMDNLKELFLELWSDRFAPNQQ